MIGTTNSNFMSQSNWEQNDPKAIDYIKGRPFYAEDPVKTTLIEEQTVTIDEDGGWSEISNASFLIEGQTYLVNFNETIYECIAWNDGYGSICIGNGELYDISHSNNEPFLIYFTSQYEESGIGCTTAGTYTFSIIGVHLEIVKIPEKYLPESASTLIIDLTDGLDTLSITTDEIYKAYKAGREVRLLTSDAEEWNLQLISCYSHYALFTGSQKFSGRIYQTSVLIEDDVATKWVDEIPLVEEVDKKQDKITGAYGQFVVIGDDGNATTKEANYAPAYTYGTTDLTAGSSTLETGKLYFVYE